MKLYLLLIIQIKIKNIIINNLIDLKKYYNAAPYIKI